MHPAQKILARTYQDLRSGYAGPLHVVNFELAEIADIVLTAFLDPKCRTMRRNHESTVTKGQSLPLCELAVEAQTLALRKMDHLEVVLVFLQPDIGVIGNARGPGRVNTRFVSH